MNGWVAAMGPTAATRFLKALQPNVAAVQKDAVEACRKVARGYSAVGIGVTADAIRLAGEGAPLKIIVPNPVAYDMNGSALRRGAGTAAKKLADFAVSPEAMEIYAATTLIVSRPGTPGTINSVPPARSKDLESIDFAGHSPFSTDLLETWQTHKK